MMVTSSAKYTMMLQRRRARARGERTVRGVRRFAAAWRRCRLRHRVKGRRAVALGQTDGSAAAATDGRAVGRDRGVAQGATRSV